MPHSERRRISRKYGARFGKIAVESGFISEAQLGLAISFQIHEELIGRSHRLIGQILFEKELMTAEQIEQVMTDLFKDLREENK